MPRKSEPYLLPQSQARRIWLHAQRLDALAPFGVKINETYLPPTRILELIGAITHDEA